MNLQELTAERAALKTEVRELDAKIDANAGRALNGGGRELLAEVQGWQAQRRAKIDRLELVEAAMRSPEIKLAGLEARLNQGFEQQLPNLKLRLRNVLVAKYADLARGNLQAIAAAINDLRDPGHLGIADPPRIPLHHLPRCYAAMLTREAEARADLAGHERDRAMNPFPPSQWTEEEHAKPARLRLTLEVRARHTIRLLEETELPMPQSVLGMV